MAAPSPSASITLPALFSIFLKVGLSFGAGTGMAAVLQDELVRKRQAIARSEFMAIFGLARLVPSGSMTALTVAIGYRYRGLRGTVVALAGTLLPGLALTVGLTLAYTLLRDTAAFRILNATLIPAALAVVVVSAFGLAREYLATPLEPLLMLGGAIAVLYFDANPSLVLLAGGVIGAIAIRDRAGNSAT